MAFRVAARTILELGAELISSDEIAIYELVKNAFDAGSKSVSVEFDIVLRRSSFLEVLELLETFEGVDDAMAEVRHRLALDPAHAKSRKFLSRLSRSRGLRNFADRLRSAYVELNTIEVRDRGTGMSFETLEGAFLTIGTPQRLLQRRGGTAGRPVLGEKGVGRLSAMRLGSRLLVRTTRSGEARWSELEIDWSLFGRDPTEMIEEIPLAPRRGEAKANARTKGTSIIVSDLASDWDEAKLQAAAETEFSRLTDPFSDQVEAFPIKISFNGEPIATRPISRMLFKAAHGHCKGVYSLPRGRPRFSIDFVYRTYSEEKRFEFGPDELRDMIGVDVPASALQTLGPFTFEFYWFNRQQIVPVDGIGDVRSVRALVNHWSGGLMLFRDGFRVNPYGGKNDDWLDLNSEAFRSRGYLLNTDQIIGRVQITGERNPALLDQTNREGLRDNFEKTSLVRLLRTFITKPLKIWIDNTTDDYKGLTSLDVSDVDRKVARFENRVDANIKKLKERFPGEEQTIVKLQEAFNGMRSAYLRVRDYGGKIDEERRRLIDLAGVGLMVEVVSHELARSTQHALEVLRSRGSVDLPADVRDLFTSLEEQLASIERRLRTIDPLSVSGRQQRTGFDLARVVEESFETRAELLKEHGIEWSIATRGARKAVFVKAVRGMVTQIVENLLTNSIHWLDVERRKNKRFAASIEVEVSDEHGGSFVFTDNGRGVAPQFAEPIFQAFYTTRSEDGGRGLGLFIGRESARFNGGDLRMLPDRRIHPDRLNSFQYVTKAVT